MGCPHSKTTLDAMAQSKRMAMARRISIVPSRLPPFASSSPTTATESTNSHDNSADSPPGLASSVHSSSNSLPSARPQRSRLGLDRMISKKRMAKSLSERVLHIEVPFGKPIEEIYDGIHDGPVLGSGRNGVVRLATHKATGIKYAVKCLDLGLIDTETELQQLYQEIHTMSQLDHPNIVRLEEVYESQTELFLVQELCSGGELFDRLDEQPDYHYTEAQCARLVKQMLCSVRYIHSKEIIHCDLKLENFVFNSRDESSEMKLIDFGLSKHPKFGERQHDAVGTPYTVAPEVIRGSYGRECDIWGIGVITYLLLSGETPFGGCGGESLIQVRKNILQGNFAFEPEEIWQNVSSKAKRFIKRLLVTDPTLRPTAREAQKDPWLIEMADRSKENDCGSLNPNVVKSLVNFKEYSDIRKLLCEVLSFTLLPNQIQELRKEFEKIDTDGSGEISLAALKSVLLGTAAQDSLGPLTEGEVEDIFNAMRISDAETMIHWHEFIAAGLSHCEVDANNLKLAFDRLDADHTGYITFENFMDLIGNGAIYSEEALRQMWSSASGSNVDAHITYEEFLLLMKGQATARQAEARPVIRPALALTNELSFYPDVEEISNERDTVDSSTRSFVMPPSPILAKSTLRAVNPEHKIDGFVDDRLRTPLAVNRELYRSHRLTRLAVLEASKRLKEEHRRRVSEEVRKERDSSFRGPGLIMRHGGELSVDTIDQFIAQQQNEVQRKVTEAKRRAGRRQPRNKTRSDIQGMLGTPVFAFSNLTLPPKREFVASIGIPDFGNPPRPPSSPDAPGLRVLHAGSTR